MEEKLEKTLQWNNINTPPEWNAGSAEIKDKISLTLLTQIRNHIFNWGDQNFSAFLLSNTKRLILQNLCVSQSLTMALKIADKMFPI